MGFLGLTNLSFPEFRERHVFTAKLRLALFAGFWILYLFFYRGVLHQMLSITALIAGCFLLTTIAYFWILKNRFIMTSIIAEVVADLFAITAIIHVAEGPYSDFFTIYLFYTFAAGIFYNYRVALVVALLSGVWYGSYLILCTKGLILPTIVDWGDRIPNESHSPPYHFFFWFVFSAMVVYGVKVASYFTQKRERLLEARNKELSALAQMSATVRTSISIEKVLEQILQSLEKGLDLDLPLILLFNEEKNCVSILPPKNHPVVAKAKEFLGRPIEDFHLPLDVQENSALQAIKNHQMFFRKNLEEVFIGIRPVIQKEVIERLQQATGFKKLVGVPLVAESQIIGAIIGFAHSSYVDDQTVKTLEAFANQVALILDAAFLIRKLREANVNLKEANRVKSEFLATMSHELRTPLTAIIGFSELLIEGVMGKMTTEQEDSLREVINNGALLLDLINNLLDMAKVEAGKMTLEIEPFDFCELLQRLNQTLASLVKKKHQKLTLDLPENAPPIHADEKKMQQNLLKLLANAIKFTPEHGKIHVALKVHESFPNFPKGAFECSVSDTGQGIKPENLEKVFEMFSQGDSSVTRKHGGTGLGLTLAKQLTELHRGKIWVESQVDRGTTFTVIFPKE
ncbi:MAG: HAMP domain-containing sensor histidine kinase [Deltaproteobacteria bacterium]|nr:HAMP domain-containing sensor histidine kinase [Deltaproteobacteria bacterium]